MPDQQPHRPGTPGSRPLRRAVASAGLALVVALAAVACGEPAGTARTNLLVVTIDTLRADHLGAWGSDVETPAIDRLAAEGIRFERAVTPSPTTLPAHASLFTGATPPTHGARDNAVGTLSPSVVTLAERFREAGFATGGFVAAYVIDAQTGMSQGFDVYTGPPLAPGVAPTGLTESERRGDEVLADALPWIREQDNDRWFAWVHLFDPHAPYTAPDDWAGRHPDRPYADEVAWTDELVRRLRQALEDSGQWQSTTVVLTADHGEALDEHGEPAHGFFLYEPTLHVPLIVRPADGVAGDFAVGTSVGTPVGLIDVFPTVAELWELDMPEAVEGRSLAPALRGEPIEPVPIYSETLLPRLYFGWSDLHSLTDDRYKVIEAPRPELYDLVADPDESDNIWADRDSHAQRLSIELDGWVERADQAAAITSDPETLAQLRSLGYLAAGSSRTDDAALADPKDRIQVYQNLMLALGAWREGQVDAALELIDAEVERDPEFAGARHMRGLVLADAGRLDEAIAAFRSALELDPEHAAAGRELARAYRQAGQLVEATGVLVELLDLDPLDMDLRFELGGLYLQQQRLDRAEAVFDEGLELEPEAARMAFGNGLVALARDDLAVALADIERAAELAPELVNVHYQRGVVLQRAGRTQEAVEAYGDEIRHRPRHYAARFNRALVLAQAGGTDAAIEDLRVAVEVRPDAAEAQLFLAQMLVEGGDEEDLTEAERLAESAIGRVRNPQFRAMGHMTLAQIYEATGRPEAAAEQRQAAQRIGGGR